MEGNQKQNNQEENSFDSFSGDGWDDYDEEPDYEEPNDNNINKEELNNQKENEIEIISPKYQKGYNKSFGNSYNKKHKKYYDYNINNKNYNYRSYKDNKNSYYERNYNNNSYYDNKNFKDNKNSYYEKNYYRNKNYYNTRDNNLVNKNISYKKGNYNYKKEYRDNKEHLKYHIFEEENIETPVFYNSKKQQIEENKIIEPKKNYILLENVLQLDKINEKILAKKNEQIQIVKEKISKNLEKEYGALNINADLYVPKKKNLMMSENKPNFNSMNHQSQI